MTIRLAIVLQFLTNECKLLLWVEIALINATCEKYFQSLQEQCLEHVAKCNEIKI